MKVISKHCFKAKYNIGAHSGQL